MNQQLVNRTVLVIVMSAISALFVAIVWPFVLELFLAALFAALFTPLYRALLERLGGRQALASAITLLIVLLFVFVPLVLVGAAVVSQAVEVAERARPWVTTQINTPGALTELLSGLPFYDRLEPFRDVVLARVGEFAGTFSGVLIDVLQSATVGTFNALLSAVIVLYTMFFFLMDGDRLLYYVLYYLPLDDEDETKLLNRFLSVTRATLKGTAVIGILQGALAGAALHFAGVPSALFWAVTMMFLSVVPGIGTALVWLPALLWVGFNGNVAGAFAAGAFCAVVVGTVDNVLRPRLVGSDAELHDLMIFFSTLGGLLLFGFTGFIIGPIVAALFVTVWELYGEAFRDWLPTTAFVPRSGPVRPPHHRRPDGGDSRGASLTADPEGAGDAPGPPAGAPTGADAPERAPPA